ncbi:MAG: hypothetical protein MJ252_15560 [archaeon]|nr:hypothetical protein [archaeon]
MSQQYINPVFLIDPLNAKCADCHTGDASFLSINNGILICANCAQKHMTLGYQISFVRDLKIDLDSYLYRFIELGGNSRFKDYLESNNIPDTTDFELKYKCAAVDYYRRNLKCKVLNLGELVKDFSNPLLVPEGNKNCFDEFETYVSVRRIEQIRGTMKTGNKVGGFFKYLGNSIVSGASTAGKFVANKAVDGKNFIVEKGGQATDKIKKTFTKKEENPENVQNPAPEANNEESKKEDSA